MYITFIMSNGGSKKGSSWQNEKQELRFCILEIADDDVCNCYFYRFTCIPCTEMCELYIFTRATLCIARYIQSCAFCLSVCHMPVLCSDVRTSRSNWPQGQTGLEVSLTLRPNWPRDQSDLDVWPRGLTSRSDWPRGLTSRSDWPRGQFDLEVLTSLHNTPRFDLEVRLTSRSNWPRGQTDLEAKILASALTSTSCSVSASSIWPRPGLGLVTCPRKCAIQCIPVVSISWLYRCNVHYKDVVKRSNVELKFCYML